MSLLTSSFGSAEPTLEIVEPSVDSTLIDTAEVVYCELYPADFQNDNLLFTTDALVPAELNTAELSSTLLEENQNIADPVFIAMDEPVAIEQPTEVQAVLEEPSVLVEEPIVLAEEPVVDIATSDEPEIAICYFYPTDFIFDSVPLSVEEHTTVDVSDILVEETQNIEYPVVDAVDSNEPFIAIDQPIEEQPILAAVEEPLVLAEESLVDATTNDEPEMVICELYPTDFIADSIPLSVEEPTTVDISGILLEENQNIADPVFIAVDQAIEALPLELVEQPSVLVEEPVELAEEALLEVTAIDVPEVVYCEIYPLELSPDVDQVNSVWIEDNKMLVYSMPGIIPQYDLPLIAELVVEPVEPLVVATTNATEVSADYSAIALGVNADVINTDEVNLPFVSDTLAQNDVVVSEQPVSASVEPLPEVMLSVVVEVVPVETVATVDELLTTAVDEPILVAIPDIIYQADSVVVEPSIAEPVEAVIEAPVSDIVEVVPVETVATVDELLTTAVDEPILVAVPDIIYQNDAVAVEPSIAEPVEAVIEAPVSDIVEVAPVETAAPVDEILTIAVVTSVEEPVLETTVDTPVVTAVPTVEEPAVEENVSIIPVLELAETSAGTTTDEDSAVVPELNPTVVSIDDLLTTDETAVPTVDEVITTAVGEESPETPASVSNEVVHDVPHGIQVTSELLLPTPVADTNHSPIHPRSHLDFMITALHLF